MLDFLISVNYYDLDVDRSSSWGKQSSLSPVKDPVEEDNDWLL